MDTSTYPVKVQVFLREDQVLRIDQEVVRRKQESRALGRHQNINRGVLIREALDGLFDTNGGEEA